MTTITNDQLSVAINDLGGELQSIYNLHTGTEYLWQGDRAFWGRRALNLFPFVGRLYQQTYTLNGQPYHLDTHGFLPHSIMRQDILQSDLCRFTMCDSAETLELYPFHFTFSIEYQLVGSKLEITFITENRSDETMYCGMGGHPGFNVPLEDGLCFEDCELSFPYACTPNLIEFSPSVLCTGIHTPYELRCGRVLPLSHNLFTQDAVVFEDAPRSVTISSPKGSRGVTVDYPQMPYVGLWHRPNCHAPFVCIEPWSTLPGREGIMEEFSQMKDLTAIPAGKTFYNHWFISVW